MDYENYEDITDRSCEFDVERDEPAGRSVPTVSEPELALRVPSTSLCE